MEFKQNCLMSKNIIPNLFSGFKYYPKTWDCRDAVLETEDQGQTSECACYSATSYVEAINRRKTGLIKNYDPHIVYEYAKSIDGYPGVDGTTLDSALKGVIHHGMIDANESDIICFNGIDSLIQVLYKYGTCLVGFDIGDNWMNHYDSLTMDSINCGKSYGGHCVTACGYIESGLFIQNSWGKNWGKYGFALIPWNIVNRQLMYGAYIKNVFNNLG